METIVDWLQADGTSRYEILVHAYFRHEEARLRGKHRVEGSFNSEIHAVYDYEEGVHSLWVEFRIEARREVGPIILRALRVLCEMPDIIGAFAVLDGHYAGFQETFIDDEWAPHGLYAFCLPNDEPILTLSASVLRSSGWKQLVTGHLAHAMLGAQSDS